MSLSAFDRSRAILVAVTLCGAMVSSAQGGAGSVPVFVLNGVVKERDGRAPLADVQVLATDTVDKSETHLRLSSHTDRRGKYNMLLPYGPVYRVEYQVHGHVTKRVIIDLSHVRPKDQEGGHAMGLEIALFTELEKVDYGAFDTPVAICRWERREKRFQWDEDYTRKREMELDELEKQHVAMLHSGGNTP